MKGGDKWACSKNGLYHEPYFEWANGNSAAAGSWSGDNGGDDVATAHRLFRGMPSVAEVLKLPHLSWRGVPQDITEFYGVRSQIDLSSGEMTHRYYPMTSKKTLVSFKVRELPKTFYKLHKAAELPAHLDLFGDITLNMKPTYLLITEGEEDAMAAFTMLVGMKHVNRLRVLSLPDGANIKALAANASKLNQVANLYFVPDMDDAGTKIIPEVWKLFPNIKFLEYSEKDACDMLRLGKVDEFYDAFMRAEKYRPSSIMTAKQLKVKAMEDVQPGLSYPFPTLTRLTYGLRTPALIAIGAGPGAGKTTLVQKLIEHIVITHCMQVGAFFFEETPADSLRRLAGHIMRKPIHLPGTAYNKADLELVLDLLADKLMFYDHRGYRDWKDVEDVLRYMAAEGVKYFVIDPLSALHAHLDSGEANKFLNNAVFQMSKMIHELDIAIFHINHLNNPLTGGKDHNEGAVVKASQFTGSRAQWRFSTDVWGARRDSTNEDPVVRNTLYLSILKNRLAGMFGEFPIRYHESTGTLEEPPVPTSF